MYVCIATWNNILNGFEHILFDSFLIYLLFSTLKWIKTVLTDVGLSAVRRRLYQAGLRARRCFGQPLLNRGVGLPAEHGPTITAFELQSNDVIVYSKMTLDTHYIIRISLFGHGMNVRYILRKPWIQPPLEVVLEECGVGFL